MENFLISGDPLETSSSDMIAQKQYLPMGEKPAGEGWRIMTGNALGNLWARVAYRYEIERG